MSCETKKIARMYSSSRHGRRKGSSSMGFRLHTTLQSPARCRSGEDKRYSALLSVLTQAVISCTKELDTRIIVFRLDHQVVIMWNE